MTKQTKSLKQFSELTLSELHHISGGDWRPNWFKNINDGGKKFTGGNDTHKIG